MKEYMIFTGEPPPNAYMSSEEMINTAASDGWRVHSFQEGEDFITFLMERDIPEPPTCAHLTKEDYETLTKAHEWLLHLGSRGAITSDEVTPETWNDYIDTRGEIASLRDRAGRL